MAGVEERALVFQAPFLKSGTPFTLTPPDGGMVVDAKLVLQ